MSPHGKTIESAADRAAEEKRRKAYEEEIIKWDAYCFKKASAKDWDSVVAHFDVYRYCGAKIQEDPRRNKEYRAGVVAGLLLRETDERKHLTKYDVAVLREFCDGKAAAFWIEGSPHTTLRYLLHDCIPTGPPVRTPPQP